MISRLWRSGSFTKNCVEHIQSINICLLHGDKGGRLKKEDRYCIVMADLHCCVAETNITL